MWSLRLFFRSFCYWCLDLWIYRNYLQPQLAHFTFVFQDFEHSSIKWQLALFTHLEICYYRDFTEGLTSVTLLGICPSPLWFHLDLQVNNFCDVNFFTECSLLKLIQHLRHVDFHAILFSIYSCTHNFSSCLESVMIFFICCRIFVKFSEIFSFAEWIGYHPFS